MSEAITCAEARDQLALLLYGELSFHEEDRIEAHLEGCAECRAAMESQKSLHAALDGIAIEPAASLLRECRAELASRLTREPALAGRASPGWWHHFIESITGGGTVGGRILRPAGAVALLAAGFFAAKLTPNVGFMNLGSSSGVAEAGMARVRDVQADPNGRVRIVVDETHERTVSGALDNPEVKALLMEAVRDPNDPGLRGQSVELLKGQQAHSTEVRDMLIYALQNDDNEGVRMKAMEGLSAFAQDPEVQSAVSQALLTDSNSGIRIQAIDMLTQGSGESLNRQVIGTLQQMMQREENTGVRQRGQRVLASFNASPGIY